MADPSDRKPAAAPAPDHPDDGRKPPADAREAKADAEKRVVPPFPPSELVSPHGAG